jgi:hypothetical protein
VAEAWRGHFGEDAKDSLVTADYRVLRRDGRAVAGAQIAPKDLDIVQLDGWDGRLLLATSPWMSQLSPFFATAPHRQVWIGNVFFETEADWRALIGGIQAAERASSLVFYLDPRSPMAARTAAAGRGWAHRVSPGPNIGLYGGFHGVPPDVQRALLATPRCFSPFESA